jgi:hypothetical protein
MPLRTAFIFGVAVLAWPVAGLAGEPDRLEPDVVQLSTEVPAHPGTSFFDLVKQVIPDLTREGSSAIGRHLVARRNFAGDGPNEPLPDPIQIGLLRALPFMSEGKSCIVMLIGLREGDDMGQQPAFLAVFDGEDGQKPTLIDAVDVGTDRFTTFADPARVGIGSGDEVILTRSGHFNGDETYDTTALLVLRDGRLDLVDTFTAYTSRTCALTTSQSFTFKATPEGQSPHYAITVTMRDLGELAETPCGDAAAARPYTRSVSTVYQWDAGRAAFRPNNDAVRRLQQETVAR